ncbi:MAG: hypothetical protein ABUS79_04540 [Pseudomonadota bacterium]
MNRPLGHRTLPPRGRFRRAATLLAGALVIHAAVSSMYTGTADATTRTFRQATAKDFEEGEATGTSVLPTGEVVPGLTSARVAVEAAFVWCGTTSRDGATAYFGTGDEGKIFVLPARASGTGAAAVPPAKRLVTLDAPWVTALATRADGTLLAGTTPGGRVFTVDPKTGTSRTLGGVAAGHVWALARDDKAGVTYVGSGAPGKIFALDDQGKSRQIWDSLDKHVVSLLRDNDGTLLAGTSEEAILYRVRTDGHAEAVQDFEAEEVRAIVRAPSGLFVAVNDFERTGIPAAMPPGPLAAKGTKIVLGAGGPPASAGTLPRPGARKAKAAIYRIEPDGHIEQVFALPDGYLTALAVAPDGSILAAAGTQGHVYRVTPDRMASLVIDLPERQALALVRSGDTVLVGTGDVGGVYRAQPAGSLAPGGRYLSKVLDADFPARWGVLRWLGSQVTFETRSGNTAKPDAGWNAWKALDKAQAAATGGVGHVASPGARYLQYRATLPAVASRLRAVTTNYLPQNQRARVTELTLADAAGASAVGALGAGTAAAARPPHSAVLKLRWKTDNPDGDELVYRLWVRQPADTVWRPVASAGADPLTKPEYDWNTEGIPDGWYVVRVNTSDERAQPTERALTSAFDSAPLLVDNGKPEVKDITVAYPVVTGRARDDASAIAVLEYAVDGGDFRSLSPADGIADDLTETFSFRLPALARGPHAVAIRATDAADNVGAAQTTVKAP